MRLIRSKGVGVYFCSQFPDDVPSEILGQLGNRIQHALRAYTPRDQKAVRTAAETFVQNPKLDVAKVISELGVGEALVSTLQENAVPMPVERTLIAPPRCRMGAITLEERSLVRAQSAVAGKYDTALNRESAYELLAQRRAAPVAPSPTKERQQGPFKEKPGKEAPDRTAGERMNDMVFGTRRRQGMVETMAKQAARTVGSRAGREILRGILGGILGGSRRS